MSHIRIDHSYYKIPEFIDFSKAVKSTVYFFLVSAVIRGENKIKQNNYIYDTFYVNGKLVSRYSQSNMANYLKTSQSRISMYIKELEKDGLVRTIYRYIGKKRFLYYQLGTWTGSIGKNSYEETLWFDIIFKKYHKRSVDNNSFIQNIDSFLNPEYNGYKGLSEYSK